MSQECKFTVDVKYTPIKTLARGAYGVVCSAIDNKNNHKKIAIKKIAKAFEDLVDAKRILREIKLLQHFKHDNIIGLYDLMNPPDSGPFDDIYLVLEFMETDLSRVISSSNDLTDKHIQYIIYQVLRGLKFVHSAQVIHRDLKPSNLLLNSNCDVKICDFGLARGVRPPNEQDYKLTEYVVTRWYRAPEVMCSCPQYDYKIDVWSVGCIMAELHGRKPLFPGDDYIKQMNLIFQTLGSPSNEDLNFISNSKAVAYIKTLKHQDKIPFNKLYPNATPLAWDLIERMLSFNPQHRISVDDALSHGYFKGLHNPKKEIVCPTHFNFDFENDVMTKDHLRELIWDEVLHYRPEMQPIRDRFVETIRGEERKQ